MTLSIETAKQNLAKAKEDVSFWENAIRLLSDPRIAGGPSQGVLGISPIGRVPYEVERNVPLPRPYGELKRKVLETLPSYESRSPLNARRLVEIMTGSGYVFASKTPSISVNEALVTLQSEGLAIVGEVVGNTRFWKKAPPKEEAKTDSGAD